MPVSKFLLLFTLFLGLPAYAGILFEPYAGYSLGALNVTGSATNPDVSLQNTALHANVDGFAYGGRAAWEFGRFFIGGEFQGTRADRKFDGQNTGVNWDTQTLYGIMGLQFELGLRVWVGTTVRPHKSEEATTGARTTYTGTSQKAGLGYKFFAYPLALNAEYSVYKFDHWERGGNKGDIKELYSKSDYNTLILSVSFPFELGER